MGRLCHTARLVGIVSALSAAVLSVGCAQYQVIHRSEDRYGDSHREVIHSLFWGAAYSPMVVKAECEHGLDRVIVHRNLGHDLLSVITLGIWMPIEIEAVCVGPPTIVGEEIPDPPDDDDNGNGNGGGHDHGQDEPWVFGRSANER